MLEQFVAVMPGTLAPALLVMSLSVMLTVGEGRDKPISSHWRLIGLIVGLIAAIVFAGLRASAVINQRTFVNYPVLWCAIIADILTIVVVVFARRITTNWQQHKVFMHIANAVAAIDIALTLFYALPDVILQLTIWVEPGETAFTSAMLLRALGFLLGVAMSIIVVAIFRTMRTTAVRWAFTVAVAAMMVILLIQHFTGLAQILQARGFPMNHTMFVALAWSINQNSTMIMAQALVFLIPAVASIVAGFRMKTHDVPGANEATLRRHKVFRRHAIAAAVWSLIAAIGVTATLTVGVAATHQTITLSPPEAYSLKDGVATHPLQPGRGRPPAPLRIQGQGRHRHALHHHPKERWRVRHRPGRLRELRRRWLLREGRQDHLQEVRGGHQPGDHRLQGWLQPDTIPVQDRPRQDHHSNYGSGRAERPLPVSQAGDKNHVLSAHDYSLVHPTAAPAPAYRADRMPVGDRVRIDAGRRVRRGRQAQRRAVHLRFEHHRAAQGGCGRFRPVQHRVGRRDVHQRPDRFSEGVGRGQDQTIFWSFNITSFAPQLNIHATVNGTNVPVVGTWFNKNLKISTGETTVVGVEGMRSWWQLDGKWPKDDSDQGVIGKTLASELGVTTGDTITLNKTTASGKKNEQKIKLTGVYDSGDEDNGSLYIASSTAQVLADLPDSVDKIEVKALTTPENDLARKAAANPAALSQEEWETWYCTAYPSSIAYQIEEVIPGAVAKQVRQVAALQGNVLQKTQAVMILMTVLSLIAAAVAVANLMVASIGERSGELALLKALGATDAAVSRLMLAETAAISLLGAIVGALLGSGVAQLIGRVVFGSGITMRPMVFVLVFVLLAVTVLLASASSIRSILNLKPAEVLHGR